MTTEDNERLRTFLQTPIGRAFTKFKNAYGRAWQFDTEDSCQDHDREATQTAWQEAEDAERKFCEMLEEKIK